MKKINYGRQNIELSDINAVKKSLYCDLITTGKQVLLFENKITNYVNSKYTVACSSGTAALHLAFLSIGLREGDSIIMPAINFVSSYNMCRKIGLKIFLADVDPISGLMTPQNFLDCIKRNKIKKIAAILNMHMGGSPNHIKEFYNLKKKYNCFLIEDACHAFGSTYMYNEKTYKIGSCAHSDICTFSFHPVKSITTGEGGAVTTNNFNYYQKSVLLRSHGIKRNKKKYWEYDVIENGFNYRISDINCALGVSQLKRINFFLKNRKEIVKIYQKSLSKYNKLIVNFTPLNVKTKSANHLFILYLNFDLLKSSKDLFIKFLNKKKIFPQFHYLPLYQFTVYRGSKMGYSGSEKYKNYCISLPIYSELKKKNVLIVLKEIDNFIKKSLKNLPKV